MRFDELTPAAFPAALLVLMALLVAFVDAPKVRRLKRFTSSAARLSVFRSTIALLCAYALMALAASGANDLLVVRRSGADMAWLLDNPLARAGAMALLALYFCLALAPALRCAIDPAMRQRYAPALRRLRFMLPVGARERRYWLLVSLAAGVCEELVFRGFLLQFLQGHPHGAWHMELTAAWLLSSLAFGCAHAYQGAAGIAATTLGGALFGLLAILSGSLLLPILLHALVDMALLLMYRPLLDDADAARRLSEGCDPAPANADLAP